MKKEILEGNKLIVAFMELKPTEWRGVYSISQDHCTCRENTPEKALNGFASIAKYHESWDWLMPVIEKIEKNTSYELTTSYDKRFEFLGWSVHWFTLKASDEILGYIEDKRFNTKIDAAWYAMVEFIKWHNENKNQ